MCNKLWHGMIGLVLVLVFVGVGLSARAATSNDCTDSPGTNYGCLAFAEIVFTNVVITPAGPTNEYYHRIVSVGTPVTAELKWGFKVATNTFQICHTCLGKTATNWCEVAITNTASPFNITNGWSRYPASDTNAVWTNGVGDICSFQFTNCQIVSVGFANVAASMDTNQGCKEVFWTVGVPQQHIAFIGVESLTPEQGTLVSTSQPPTYVVCAVPTNAAVTNLIITAVPCPTVEATNLPAGWTMSGGNVVTNASGTNRTQRAVNLTVPGTNTITADCGVSHMTNIIIVERTTLTLERTNVFVNQDDDNANGTNDVDEFNGDAGLVVTNEHDLRLMTFKVESPGKTNEVVTLSVWPIWWPYGHVRVWDSPQRGTNPPVLDNWTSHNATNWTVSTMPTNLWVEGVGESMDLNDVTFTIQTEYGCEVSKSLTVWSFALDGDGDHDGSVARGGEDHRLKNKPLGVIVPTNVDDDDGKHAADNSDAKINGADDLNDLAPVILRRLPWIDSSYSLVLTLHSNSNAGTAAVDEIVRVFSSNTDTNAVQILGPGVATYTLTPSNMTNLQNGDLTFGVEGRVFAGEVRLKAELKDGTGTNIVEDEILLKASPFILLPGTAAAQKFYVLDWDTNFVAALEAAVGSSTVTQVSSASYPDVWVQDQVEIGYTHWPLGQLQTVWNLPRNRALQRWPTNELLASGYGHFREGSSAGEHYGGNIEVTPPVTVGTNEYKLGLAVMGSNSSLKDLINRQKIQTPIVELDVSWLAVGHVDEVVSFVSDGTGFKVLIADTTRAMNLLRGLNVETNGTSTGGSTTTLVDTNMNWTADMWQDGFLAISTGTNAGNVRQIAGNTVDTITIQGSWPAATGTNAQYQLVARSAYHCFFVEGNEDLGVVTSGFGWTNSKVDGTKGWTANQWTNGCLRIVAGTGAGQISRVVSNTVNTLYTESSLGTDATSRYVVAASSKQWADVGYGRKYAMISAREVVLDPVRATSNATDQAAIDQIKYTLETQLDLATNDFVAIPVLFADEMSGHGGRVAWTPGIVNLLVDGNNLVAAKPFAPRDQGADVFESAVTQALSGFTVNFVDDWESYHIIDGEVHCGTNAKRIIPSTPKWWEPSSP